MNDLISKKTKEDKNQKKKKNSFCGNVTPEVKNPNKLMNDLPIIIYKKELFSLQKEESTIDNLVLKKSILYSNNPFSNEDIVKNKENEIHNKQKDIFLQGIIFTALIKK